MCERVQCRSTHSSFILLHMHRRTLFTITAVLQPIGDLDKGKKYTVTITKEVEDQAGKKMA
jgi:hypothetical protein